MRHTAKKQMMFFYQPELGMASVEPILSQAAFPDA